MTKFSQNKFECGRAVRFGRGCGRLSLLLCAATPATLQADNDDWPIRLSFVDEGRSKTRLEVVAHNLADFPCTKLKLRMTIDQGWLTHGGGHSAAKLVDGQLIFDEIASLAPGEKIRWHAEYKPAPTNVTSTITAILDYAEKKTAVAKPSPARKGCADYAPSVAGDMSVAEISFPTGSRSTSALLVHQVMPREVEKGKTFSYQYHVTNLSAGSLQNVDLQASSFRNLTVAKSDPAGETIPDGIRWRIGEMGECETKIITVQATSPDVGTASACISATFSNRLCSVINVVEPALKLEKKATPEILICDEAEIVLTATNPGTGIARGVKVTDDLPEGLAATDGRKKVEGDAGDLAPGQSKQLSFKVKASKTGSFVNGATARSSNNLTAESNKTTTIVRKPVLEIACTSPPERYIGRDADFCFEVKNTGDAVAADTVVSTSVPAGEVVEIRDKGARQDKNIVWSVGALKPAETRKVCFRSRVNEATVLRTAGRATARCAEPVSASCETKVIGIPAILLEVIDLDDPVEVGKTTTYVITVTNQGTAPDTNIQVIATIPDQAEYVSATGATPPKAEGQKVTFSAVAKLEPKQKVEWRLIVRAKKPGDVRFALEMNSDQLTSPVRETEATKLYE